MNILMADDTEMHRTMFLNTIKEIPNLQVNVLGLGRDGEELCQLYKSFSGSHKIDAIFCDIRMPKMDGLSALAKILGMNPHQVMVMVSSEDLAKMEMINIAKGDQVKAQGDLAKKLELIDKIVERLRKNIIEPGKVNSILEGCEKLAADPVDVARHIGARGYVRKPYDAGKLSHVIAQLASSPFAKAV